MRFWNERNDIRKWRRDCSLACDPSFKIPDIEIRKNILYLLICQFSTDLIYYSPSRLTYNHTNEKNRKQIWFESEKFHKSTAKIESTTN